MPRRLISWVSDCGRVTCLTSLGNRTGCCHVEGSVQILQSKTITLGGRAYFACEFIIDRRLLRANKIPSFETNAAKCQTNGSHFDNVYYS